VDLVLAPYHQGEACLVDLFPSCHEEGEACLVNLVLSYREEDEAYPCLNHGEGACLDFHLEGDFPCWEEADSSEDAYFSVHVDLLVVGNYLDEDAVHVPGAGVDHFYLFDLALASIAPPFAAAAAAVSLVVVSPSFPPSSYRHLLPFANALCTRRQMPPFASQRSTPASWPRLRPF